MNMDVVPAERPSVYLASKSPRRQELLRQLGVDFTPLLMREAAGRPRDIVEIPRADEPPLEYVKRLARTKASVGWHVMGRRGLAPKPMLGADTEVVRDGAVLGKPSDAAGAVGNAATPLRPDARKSAPRWPSRWDKEINMVVSSSRVSFRALTDDEIERYVATGEPFDKAGAYAIQGRGAAFVSHLEGSYSGVMGLPLFETAGLLAKIGFPVL